MTLSFNCHLSRAISISLRILPFLLFVAPRVALSCDFPPDFPQAYKDIYEFSKNLNVKSIHGVDECLGREQKPLTWTRVCDSQGKFQSLKAEIFLLPKVTLSFNDKNEFVLENFYFSDWNYSKVDASELAEVFIKRGKELKLIYTTESARKVHLTLVRNDSNELEIFETLVYKMNIGTPSLESKFSCFEI